MDKTDRLRDYGLAFLLYEQGLGLCGYELIRELFIFVKLILNSYLAKVSFNGENHLAIVLNERMGYDWLGEIKSSLLSFMESSFVGSENEFENDDLYNIMSLLREMDFTDNQRIAMYNNYFGKDNKEFQETKEATITF